MKSKISSKDALRISIVILAFLTIFVGFTDNSAAATINVGSGAGNQSTTIQGVGDKDINVNNGAGSSTVSATHLQTLNTKTKSNASPLVDPPTAIAVDPASGFLYDVVDLNATLTDTSSNIPVEGKEIFFSINGMPVGSEITDINGIATIQYLIDGAFLLPGDYPIQADFLGDPIYTASSNTNTLTVNHIPTAVAVDPVSGFKGNIVDLTATLTDTQSNIPLFATNIDFSVNGNPVGSATTDDNGIATLPYTITQNFGTYTILAEFLQDTYYAGSSNTNTLDVLDSTPPVVTSTNPVNNAFNVALNKVIKITFNEAIKFGTGSWIELYATSTGIAKSFTQSITGNVLSITPNSPLSSGTKYTVILHTNSITDLAGNGLAAPYTTRFTTSAPPVVTSTSPVNNEVNVALNKIVHINFSKAIQLGTNPWIEFKNQFGQAKPFTTSINGSTLNLTTNATYARGTTYTVILHSNSVTSTGGAGLAAPYTTKFTTTTA